MSFKTLAIVSVVAVPLFLLALGISMGEENGFRPVLVVGLVLGYVWQQTGGNTTASALVHGIYNSIGMAIAYFITV